MRGGRRLFIGIGICVGAIVLGALLFMPFPKPLRFTIHIPPGPAASNR
jgi:hypothetical protein